jgi:cobalamin transport system ATP-binding protein
LLACKNLHISAGDKHLFTCESLLLLQGVYALIGRNGAGKSTFLSTILDEIVLQEGSIQLEGKEIAEFSLNEKARRISIVRSKPVIYGEYSVYDILMLGRLPYQGMMSIASEEDKGHVKDVARVLNIDSFMEQDYNLLSDGEKQLVMIGRAIVQDTPLILLDEPSAFLDLVNRQELLALLRRLADEHNKLIVFSSHHVEVLSKFCDGILLIQNNELSLHDSPSEFNAIIKKSFGLNSLV